MALRNALRNIFAMATLSACWLHYCQALRHNSLKIANFGAILKKDVSCYKWYRTFLSLPLAQPRQIAEMFIVLKDKLLELPKKTHNCLKLFVKYFEMQWMIKVRLNNFLLIIFISFFLFLYLT